MASDKPLSTQRRNTLLRMIALFGVDGVKDILLERKTTYPYDKLFQELYGNEDTLRKEAYDYLLRFKLNLKQYKEGEYDAEQTIWWPK